MDKVISYENMSIYSDTSILFECCELLCNLGELLQGSKYPEVLLNIKTGKLKFNDSENIHVVAFKVIPSSESITVSNDSDFEEDSESTADESEESDNESNPDETSDTSDTSDSSDSSSDNN
jgi:hypothetical protein